MGNMYHRSKSNLYAALFLLRPCLALVFLLPAQTPLHLHTLGLCDLCPSLEKQLLVFPGHKCGSLQLVVSCSVGRWVGWLSLWTLGPCPPYYPEPQLLLPTVGPGEHKAWHFVCSIYHQRTSERCSLCVPKPARHRSGLGLPERHSYSTF